MITIQETLQIPDVYPLERLGRQEDLLFFDIETTGFSGDTSCLYLIGCAYYKEDTWHCIQWFADTKQSEPALLHAFFDLLTHFSILVHFNGDGFDIPFLIKRCAYYQLPYDFSAVTSLDIYKKFRPYKKLLGLSNLKQKTIEHFLGIYRKDRFHGGELIALYQTYLRTKDSELLQLLLLHNEEDVKGMTAILPALFYPDFLESDFTLCSQKLHTVHNTSATLELQVQSTCSIPKPFQASCPIGTLTAAQNQVTLMIPLFVGTLKYFYPDYKNYYYLPAEDRAIHKSIGEFVDPSARKKATPKTCYQTSSGVFLPQMSPVLEPVFREELEHKKTSLTYVPYTLDLLKDSTWCSRFLRHILCCASAITPQER